MGSLWNPRGPCNPLRVGLGSAWAGRPLVGTREAAGRRPRGGGMGRVPEAHVLVPSSPAALASPGLPSLSLPPRPPSPVPWHPEPGLKLWPIENIPSGSGLVSLMPPVSCSPRREADVRSVWPTGMLRRPRVLTQRLAWPRAWRGHRALPTLAPMLPSLPTPARTLSGGGQGGS